MFKRLILSALVCLAAIIVSAQTLPCNFKVSEENFAKCLVIDNNHDGDGAGNNVWSYMGLFSSFSYFTETKNAADDWLILPLLDFGGTTEVKVSLKVSSVGMHALEVKLGQERSIEGMTVNVFNKNNILTDGESKWMTAYVELPATDNGNQWALGLHAITEAGHYMLSVHDMIIEDATVATAVPAAPSIKKSAPNRLVYNATVTMPLKDLDAREIVTPLSLAISVDGNLIETKTDCEPGADVDVSYELAEGIHEIKYKAVVGKVESQEVVDKVISSPYKSYNLPYIFSESENTFDEASNECIEIDNNHDGEEGEGYCFGKWSHVPSSVCFSYYPKAGNVADDWLVLPLVNFGEATKAKISVKVSNSDTHALEVMLGQNPTIESMNVTAFKKMDIITGVNQEEWFVAYVELPASGNGNRWHLGLHEISESNELPLDVYDIVIEDATNATIEPAAPILKSSAFSDLTYSATVTMPAIDVEGVYIAMPMSLMVSVDGEVVETLTDCIAGEDVEISLPLAFGEHQISYKAVLANGESRALTDDVTVPHSLPFEFQPNETTFNECIVIDVDNDAYECTVGQRHFIRGGWYCPGGQYFWYFTNPKIGADDWIIFPLVDFGASKRVKVSLDMSTVSTTFENFEVYIGQTRTVAGMSKEILKKYGFIITSWNTLSAEVELPEQDGNSEGNGIWCVGVHASSSARVGWLSIRNVTIEDADPISGFDDVVTYDSDVPVEYYNLQGLRIYNPEAGSLVIERRGNKTVKKIVR